MNTATKMQIDDEDQLVLRETFLEESTQHLEDYEFNLIQLDQSTNREYELNGVFRAAHSLKGSAASVGFMDLSKFAHLNEDLLSLLKSNPELVDKEVNSLLLHSLDVFRQWITGLKSKGHDFGKPKAAGDMDRLLEEKIRKLSDTISKGTKRSIAETVNKNTSSSKSSVNAKTSKSKTTVDRSSTSVKIEADRLDAVMDLVGELVVIKSQILDDEGLQSTGSARANTLLTLLDKNVRDLYERTLSLRMTSVKSLMLKLERAVRDAALKVNKDVDFKVSGEDCEMDRLLIEKISDPLMHILRNAVDHGLENTDDRIKSGKPKTGKIRVTVANRGSGINFEISDDGRGINRDVIVAKAVEKGFLDKIETAKNFSDLEVYNFLFMPGFSTAAKITDLSGRGVGLDVVRSNILALKGSVDITSTVGLGSMFTLRLPLTTAIADGLIVRVANENYIIPLDAVDEVLPVTGISMTAINRHEQCVEVHGKFLPMVDLIKEFELSGGQQNLVIILRSGLKKYAIKVDEIIGQSQVVLKNLHENIANSKGIAGTAILGNGKVALIVDVTAMSPI